MCEITRKDVKPSETNEEYSSSFYASLYNTLVLFGMNEQRLVWMRYTGFLVLQGFIINTITQRPLNVTMLLSFSILGIACSTVWDVLNFAGWLNQNFWFTRAAALNFTKLNIQLPTDWWVKKRALKPTGKIYHIAQTVPRVLLLFYGIAVVHALNQLKVYPGIGVLTALVLVATACKIFLVIEKKEYSERRYEKDGRPIS